MCSFKNYGRTVSDGETGDAVTVTFSGSEIAFIGASKDAVIKVEIDGKVVVDAYKCADSGERQSNYKCTGLENTQHIINITIVEGSFSVDALEYK